jgi:hypothetical protein
MTQNLAGSRHDPLICQTDFQDQIDLARWEGEGGAPAPRVAHADTSRAEAPSATRMARTRDPLPAI